MSALRTRWPAAGQMLLDQLRSDGQAVLRLADLPALAGDNAATETGGALVCLPFGWGDCMRDAMVLSVAGEDPLWPEEDLRFIRLVAESIGHSLQHHESEQVLLDHGRFLEDLDRISRTLNGRVQDADLMTELTSAILDIFQADRAFFLHPADPDAASFSVRIEATRPEWPGIFTHAQAGALGVEVEPDPLFREDLRQTLIRQVPLVVQFAQRLDGADMAKRHGVQSLMMTALYPQGDQPWILGIQQCAAPRHWSAAEQRLFKVIAERAGEALSGHLLLQRVQASEQRYRAVFDNVCDAIIVHDFQGCVVAVNQAMLSLFGLAQDAVLTTSIADLSGPGNPPDLPMETIWQRAAAEGELHFEWEARRPKDGLCFPVDVILKAIEFGGAIRILAIVRDLRARKAAEAELRASEERFAKAFRLSPAPTVISNLDDWRIIDANDRWLEAMSYRREEVIGRTATEVDLWVDPDVRDQLMAELQAFGTVRDFPIRIRSRTGDVLDHLWSAEIIDLGGQRALLSAVQDITERKRAEEALRQSEERFAKTFNSSPAPMLVTTIDEGRILAVNQQWLSLMEAESADLIGRTTQEVGLWDDPGLRERMILQLRSEGPFQNVPMLVRTSRGHLRDLLWSTEVIRFKAEEVLLSVVHDLTEQKCAEAALQESERRYRTIFEAAAVALWEEDLTLVRAAVADLRARCGGDVRGYLETHPEAVLQIMNTPRFVNVNQRAVRLFGAPSKEELLNSRGKIRLAETVLAVREILIAIAEELRYIETEMRCQTLQGERLDLLLSVALPEPNSPFRSLLASMVDITDRKRAERALRESEARLRTAIESIPFDFFILDTDGRYLLQNTASQRNWGEVIGKCPSDLEADPNLIVHWQSNSRRAATGEVIDEELCFVRDGRERFARTVMAPVMDGRAVQGLVGLSIDITERKRAERALRLAQVCILRSADAVFWITPQCRIIYVNDQACASLGYERSELLGMTVLDIDPDLDEERWSAVWEDIRVLKTGRLETRHRRRDGSCFPVEIMANYVAYEGEEYSFTFVRDISDRKRTEAELSRHREHLEALVQERTAALEEANQHLQQAMTQLMQAEKLAALGRLVAGMAHELNTPLGNARMVASTLDEWLSEAATTLQTGELCRSDLAELFARGREAADLLQRNTARAADLIGHFKEVAVDQTSMRRRQFNLRQTLEEVLATLGPTFKRTAHRVELDIPSDLELNSYPGPLEQVIANLITNSLTHGFPEMEAGCIEITAESLGGERILLRYGDDGGGIPEEMQAHIFEPFFTTRLGQGGSGLGLYIVYNLVTNVLGGAVVIDRQAGPGARFRINLPCTAPQPPTVR